MIELERQVPVLGDCCRTEPAAEAMASPTPLAGVHWICATIPAICDDLHQAFVVAKGAATNTAAGSANRRRVSIGAQAGARWRGRQGCEVQEE